MAQSHVISSPPITLLDTPCWPYNTGLAAMLSWALNGRCWKTLESALTVTVFRGHVCH
jgi:hypothetical protein